MGLVYSDCDYPEVQSVTTPTAKKSHACTECGRTIKPGEKYTRYFQVTYGEAATNKLCAECDALSVAFFKALPKEYRHEVTYEWGNLRGAIIEARTEYGAVVPGFEYPQEADHD